MDKYGQLFHIEPPDGWLNDPNGLCYFDGNYHVFFQYSPKSPEGKTLRSWGHYMGKSLSSLKYVGVAIKPEIDAEKNGVYSGSATVNDKSLHIFYTGNVKHIGDYNYVTNGREGNVIRVQSEDGLNFSEKKILLTNFDYPIFCTCHVRDPKVWCDEESNDWRMVLGARTVENKGCVLIYRSDNLLNWKYVATVSSPDFGYMWECPDYFKLGDVGRLSVSPQGMKHYDDRYQNLYQSGYFKAEGRLEDNRLSNFREWDMGFDFYAPQTFEAPDGRRILIAWMGMDTKDYSNATTELGRQHCLTVPRELIADGDLIKQRPIAEIEELFAKPKEIKNDTPTKTALAFKLNAVTDGDFRISLDGKFHIVYSTENKRISIEFTDEKYGCGRTVRNAPCEKCDCLELLADSSSAEIFVNGGELVFSTRFYPDYVGDGETGAVMLEVSGGIKAESAEYMGK